MKEKPDPRIVIEKKAIASGDMGQKVRVVEFDERKGDEHEDGDSQDRSDVQQFDGDK